ncbi:MAG TPA: hypothetical protein VFS43_34550 [Polyangiaceae bacterium]|nr:hypothetical protein [Polyangiaceae bacterium]
MSVSLGVASGLHVVVPAALAFSASGRGGEARSELGQVVTLEFIEFEIDEGAQAPAFRSAARSPPVLEPPPDEALAGEADNATAARAAPSRWPSGGIDREARATSGAAPWPGLERRFVSEAAPPFEGFEVEPFGAPDGSDPVSETDWPADEACAAEGCGARDDDGAPFSDTDSGVRSDEWRPEAPGGERDVPAPADLDRASPPAGAAEKSSGRSDALEASRVDGGDEAQSAGGAGGRGRVKARRVAELDRRDDAAGAGGRDDRDEPGGAPGAAGRGGASSAEWVALFATGGGRGEAGAGGRGGASDRDGGTAGAAGAAGAAGEGGQGGASEDAGAGGSAGAAGAPALGCVPPMTWGSDEATMGGGLAGGEPPRLEGVRHLAAGRFHTCAQLDERVACWGHNAHGQLGNALNAGVETANGCPSAVASDEGLPKAMTTRQLALGARHSCALLDDGTVECWGDNRYGQLGHPQGAGEKAPTPSPRPVLDEAGAPLGHVLAIAAGADHTCARFEPGQGPASADVACWGRNQRGQLDGANAIDDEGTAHPSPRPVREDSGAPLRGVSDLAAGDMHTCALREGGRVWCWGSNRFGELGHPDRPVGLGAVPSGVKAVPGVGGGEPWGEATQIVASAFGICALLSRRQVICWGSRALIADIEFIVPAPGDEEPRLVAGSEGSWRIFAGGAHFCLQREGDDAPACWGSNAMGQLGGSSAAAGAPIGTYSETAQAVLGGPAGVLRGASDLALGLVHSCARIGARGELACWGVNTYGQLGSPQVGGAPTFLTTAPTPTRAPRADGGLLKAGGAGG